ncbi:MAG TPA: COX15/CtaA family protein [Flavitalea sp.]|nr:COX15/CtaA family protein [Flavitalea sp.]
MKISSKPVAIWIGIGVLMLLIQVILGGVTRLTGSGLSITEWNVITGALPPLNHAAWVNEFNKYKQTPQYHLLNVNFTLSDFKFIFFWEWLHRLWARLIGVIFIIGFIYLVSKKHLKQEMIRPLLILFLLGALQGAVGWIMVASGLTGDAVYVKPTRLALHFIFAMVLIAYAYWYFLVLVVPENQRIPSGKIKSFTGWLLMLTAIQLVFGALMAGHKAATAAPGWPDINGSMLPDAILRDVPVLLNFIENKITIHFVHRNLAYIIFVLVCILTWKLYHVTQLPPVFNKLKAVPLLVVLIQIILGILSLVTSAGIVPNHWGAFDWFAQLHQVTGMLFALCLISLFYLVRRR